MRPVTKEMLDQHEEVTPFLSPLPPHRSRVGANRTLYMKTRPTGYAPPSAKPIEDASLLGLPYELFHRIARSNVRTCGLLRMSGFMLKETKNDRKQWAYEERRRLRGADKTWFTDNDAMNAAEKMIYAYTHLTDQECNVWFDTYGLKDAKWVEVAFRIAAEKIALSGVTRNAEAIQYDPDSHFGKFVKCASIMRMAPKGVGSDRIGKCVLKNMQVVLMEDRILEKMEWMICDIIHRRTRKCPQPNQYRVTNFINSEGGFTMPEVIERFGAFKIVDTSGSIIEVS